MLNCTPIEYCMGNISKLSDSELLQVIAAIKREQSFRENQRKKECVDKAVAAIKALQEIDFNGCLTIGCPDCDCEICLSYDEVAEEIKNAVEC